ncbi:MAG: alanine racemase [Firmicutes bacterium]|nr:alanine racemase [Bacillota bacterium]
MNIVGKDVRDNYYPRVTCDLGIVRRNTSEVMQRAESAGIEVAGVVKCVNGLPEVAKVLQDAGCRWIATSRMDQFIKMREAGITAPFMLIRVPMLSEVPEVIDLCDVSLNSDMLLLEALDAEACAKNKTHNVILMAEVGDLREGFWDRDELIDAARFTETARGLHLLGLGMNIGCYGSVAATKDKMQELVDAAELVEAAIGRRLEVLSGADTTAFPRVLDHTMPERINNMRLGEILVIGRDLQDLYDCPTPFLDRTAWHLQAEVLEVHRKPTHPIGELCTDAFGHKQVYTDRGIRKRALLGIGRLDYAFPEELIPTEPGIEVIGASSDHTIIDIEDCSRELKAGDIVEFEIRYTALLYLTDDSNVAIEYI